MATHALITITAGSKNHKKPVLKIYKHWDGYLESLGLDILSFLSKTQFSRGMVESDERTIKCNGSDEFSAKFLAYLKEMYPNGDVYLADLEACSEDVYARYEYTISICDRFDDSDISAIDEIKVREMKATRRQQIFRCSEGGHDEIIRNFHIFLQKKCRDSFSASEFYRMQALSGAVTKGMIARNITQVLLSEILSNKKLVEFNFLSFQTFNGESHRRMVVDGSIKVPALTDELAYAATNITPNNIISEVEIGVSLVETTAGSGEYIIKDASFVRLICKTPDPLSKAVYLHRLQGIKLHPSEIYAATLNTDGSGKYFVIERGSDSTPIQAKFATSNPAAANQNEKEAQLLF